MGADDASPPRLPGRDVLLVLLVCLTWGLNFIPIRWALDEIPPFMLAALRFLLAAVPLVFFVKRPAMPWLNLIGYGVVIGVFQFGLLFLAIRLGLAAGLASLLMQMQMFFTIGLARIWTGDRIRAHQAVGGIVSALGVGALAFDLLADGARATAWGLLLIGLSSFSWAFGNVLAKATSRGHRFDMFGLVVWSSLAAPIPLAAVSYATEGGTAAFQAVLDAGPRTLLSVLFMSYAATLFGYAAWNRLLQRHAAATVTPFTMAIPVAGLGGASLVLHEALTLTQVLAAIVILGGIAAATLGDRLRRKPSGKATPPLALPD